MTWGGAQWLVVFFVGMRVLLGAAKAYGNIAFKPRPQTPAGEFFSQRLFDALLLGVLYWGGFFS